MSAVERFYQVAEAKAKAFKEWEEVKLQLRRATEQGDRKKIEMLRCLRQELMTPCFEKLKLFAEARDLALSEIAQIPENKQKDFQFLIEPIWQRAGIDFGKGAINYFWTPQPRPTQRLNH